VSDVQRLELTGLNRHRKHQALGNLSAVVIDGDDIRLDNGALHGKAFVEKGVRWVADIDDVPAPRRIAVVWVTIRRTVVGRGISGLGATLVYIDDEAKVGFKDLADQVNKMDAAVKGQVRIEALNQKEHHLLGSFLHAQRDELWENAAEAVWSQWLTPAEYASMQEKLKEATAYRLELARQAATAAEAAKNEQDESGHEQDDEEAGVGQNKDENR